MTSPRILIIGAGFGGLGTAIELIQHGFADVTILEKADDVGGVWRDNTYPNAACDVPSSLYSWSFAPKPDWPRRYSGQADILGYIRAVADEHGLTDRIRTGVEVTAATFDDATATWRVETGDGDTYEAEFLVSAVGQLSRPVIPDVPGTETFTGPAFHSARWDHEIDLAGKKVAVLGTGASAIQFVPGIQPVAGEVTVFQRSAPYVVPKADRAYTRTHHRAFARFPRSQAFGRKLTWVMSEQLNKSLVGTNPMKKVLEAAWRLHLRRQVRDPQLRAKLRPDYPIGCKRLLFSNDWYPALAADNVEVVTEHVVEVLPHGVRTADGTEHEADVIIYGTGFAATEFLAPMKITGSHGVDLNAVWA
ncbi:MAG: flavin-containing monooxygenase, partial [Marmoricola sp.]